VLNLASTSCPTFKKLMCWSMLVHNIDPRMLHKEERKKLVSSSRHLAIDKLKVSGNMLSMLHEMTR
jgi:hypothetical protein